MRRPTRRDLLRTGALGAGTLLAGCAGNSPTETPVDEDSETDTPESEATPTETGHSVTLAPTGTVEFEAVPQDVLVYSLLYADMAVAYGHGDAVNSLGFSRDIDGQTLQAFYERLDGVSFDYADLTQLKSESGFTIDRELFYELDSDLHLMDPALLSTLDGWDPAAVEQISETVAPFFGNAYSRTHAEPPEAYADAYEYYDLWDLSGRIAGVFQERERHEALRGVHEDLLATIESGLPAEGERPRVAVAILVEETFYPSKLNGPGFAAAHTRPLDARDAFVDDPIDFQTTYDYETMLDVDPDVLLVPFALASYYDIASIRASMESHSAGSELTAVQEGRVYASGNPVQGPLMNLFQLEMTAKQLYPEQFGAWPDYDGGAYPTIPEDERLFDRERVARIVRGDA